MPLLEVITQCTHLQPQIHKILETCSQYIVIWFSFPILPTKILSKKGIGWNLQNGIITYHKWFLKVQF